MEVPTLKLTDNILSQRVSTFLSDFILDDHRSDRVLEVFETELETGMKNGLEGSSLQMENTYVPDLINGTEEGQFLALDLGGTNFRVILLEMKAGKIVREEVQYYQVPEEKRLGPGEDLFDFLAVCIYDFTDKLALGDSCQSLPLGFTFSFPMTQTALNQGVLVSWTKSFNCPGVVGKDVVGLLNHSLAKVKPDNQKNLTIEVVAILNDTTGTLVKGAYDRPNTCIGLILGTGCNGAYFERSENVLRWHGGKYDCKNVIIDPEFGAFGDNGCLDFIKTQFDKAIDVSSLLPQSFTYEKYFAGKYIGELARIVMVGMNKERLLFPCQDVEGLLIKDAFPSTMLTEVVEDNLNQSTERTINVLKKFSANCSPDDALIVQHICVVISERAALLVGIPMAVFLRRMRTQEGHIAVTGSLYKCHPNLKARMEYFIRKYYPEWKGESFLSDDGSGKGAGLIAAIARRLGI